MEVIILREASWHIKSFVSKLKLPGSSEDDWTRVEKAFYCHLCGIALDEGAVEAHHGN